MATPLRASGHARRVGSERLRGSARPAPGTPRRTARSSPCGDTRGAPRGRSRSDRARGGPGGSGWERRARAKRGAARAVHGDGRRADGDHCIRRGDAFFAASDAPFGARAGVGVEGDPCSSEEAREARSRCLLEHPSARGGAGRHSTGAGDGAVSGEQRGSPERAARVCGSTRGDPRPTDAREPCTARGTSKDEARGERHTGRSSEHAPRCARGRIKGVSTDPVGCGRR